MWTGNPVRRGGGRGYPGGEAFRCPEANLLPVTKFVGNGLLIKCLGQVDLPNAPLEHRPLDIPALPHAAPDSPGIGWPLGCGKERKGKKPSPACKILSGRGIVYLYKNILFS